MELNRKKNNKFSNINPSCIKDINLNCVNIFDTKLGCLKMSKNDFEIATKLKRNFK